MVVGEVVARIPSDLYPSGGTTVSWGNVVCSWVFHGGTGGLQGGAQVEYWTVNSDGTEDAHQTVTVTGVNSLATIEVTQAAGRVGFRWRVRCKDQGSDTYGEWSAVQLVRCGYAPIVSFPSATGARIAVDSSEYLLVFDVSNADDHLECYVTVSGGARAERVTETSWRITGLVNGNRHAVSVRASNGTLQSSAGVTLDVTYAEVAKPVLSFNLLPVEGAIEITVSKDTDVSGVQASYYVLERSIDDGETWETVASYISEGETVRDDWCSVFTENLYQAWGVKEGV